MTEQRQIADILEEKAVQSSREDHLPFDPACAWAQLRTSQRTGFKSAHINTSHRTRDLLFAITDFSCGLNSLPVRPSGRQPDKARDVVRYR